IEADQVLTTRCLVGDLTREVLSAAVAAIRLRENLERTQADRGEAVRRDPADHAAVLEAPTRIAGAAREACRVITNVRKRVAAAVHALREVALALQGRWDRGEPDVLWREPALELLAPEEEQLLLQDRPPGRVAPVVARVLWAVQTVAVIGPKVGVP